MSIWGVPRWPATAVRRTELIARIEAPTPLVVVSGFAGTGKTTLLAQWGNDTAQYGVWIGLADARTESCALVLQIAQALLDSGGIAAGNPLSTTAEAMAGGAEPFSLLRRGLQIRGEDLVVVVDRAELLTPDAVDGLVATLAQVPSLRIVAATRASGALTAETTGVAVDRTLIGPADLALDAHQIATLLGADEADDIVRAILDAGGSAHLARAVSLTAAGDGDGAVRLARAVDSFEAYVWNSGSSRPWDAEFADFLTATAVAESLSDELASLLSGSPRADEMLRRAEEEGLGLFTDAATGRLFGYSPLIREILLRAARRERPTQLGALHRTVGQWSLRNDRPFFAISHAVAAGDLELASAVVRQSYFSLLRNHGLQLRELFADVPLLTLRRFPLLAMMLALHYNAAKIHRARALELFAVAIAASRLQLGSTSPADRAILRTVESSALRVMGRFDGALAAAADAHGVLRNLGDADRAALGRLIPVLYSHVGTSYLYNGRTTEALACFAESFAEGQLISSPAGLEGLALQAGTLAISGDIVEAQAAVAVAEQQQWPDGWIDGYMGSFYQLAKALIALESFDADAAQKHIRLLDRHRDTIEHWPLLAHVDALVRMVRGQAGQGLLEFENTVRNHRGRASLGSFTATHLRDTRSLLQLADGDPAAAEHSLSRRSRRTVRDDVALARIALVNADPAAALRLLATGRPSDAGSSRVEVEERMIRAAALAELGQPGAAVTALRDALLLMGDRQQGLALALIPVEARRALVRLARAAGHGDLADTLDAAGIPGVLHVVDSRPRLSPRERAVARQLVLDLSVVDIAASLNVSPNTVKSQLRSIYRKLGVSTRSDAIAKLAGETL